VLTILLVAAAVTGLARAQDTRDETDWPEIVVEGDIPHCVPRHGDPLDLVDTSRAPLVQSVIQRDREDIWRVTRDNDPVTGPEIWQRAGRGIGDFHFRGPVGDLPLCIGSRTPRPQGFGQLRRVLDAVPLHDRYARFTAYVATRKSNEVRFWLAAGDHRRIYQGGDTRARPIKGSRRWIAMKLTIGPIPRQATKLSYGFLLKGAGDVWVVDPKLEILESAESEPGTAHLNDQFGR